MTKKWHAIVLAAGRGPDDPIAKAYGVRHKCTIAIAGKPMLLRVVETLAGHHAIESVKVVIDDPEIARQALGSLSERTDIVPAASTAATSALAAVNRLAGRFPVLITTGDHPLLTGAMLTHFLREAERSGADLCAGLATAETILAAYPLAKRTFLTFGRDRVSGCNLYALMNTKALPALSFWSHIEQIRKQPWRIVGAFGLIPLLRYLVGVIDLQSAFALASKRLGLRAKPVLMPFAEASVDVDKPADKELVERILAGRR